MALAPLSQTLVLTADASTVPLAELVEIPSGIVIVPVTIGGTPGAATQGTAYSFTPTTANGSGTKAFALTGTLPAGLTFSTTTGSITGTPSTAGTTTGLNITVTDASGIASLGAFALVVTSNATVPAAVASFTATPGNGQVTLAWTDGATGGSAITAHKLYAGSASGATTLLGTITSASPYIDTGLTNATARFYRLSAVNAVGEGPLSAEVSATPRAPLSITGTPGAATVGTAYTFAPAASGGLGTKTFALTGTLPAGLTFSTSTGAISGTPTAAGTTSGLKITVTDPNGGNASLGTFAIVVGANSAIVAPARYAAYSDDFETSGVLTSRPNWSDLGSGQISRWSTGNGFLYNNNLYNSYNVIAFGAQVSDFIVTKGYDFTGTYPSGITDTNAWDKFRQSDKIWYRDGNNNLDASYDPDSKRLSIGGIIGGTSITSMRFENVQYLPKGDIVFVMQAGKLRVRLDGKWLQSGPSLTYPFDQIDLSSAVGASDRIGYFGIGAGTWRYAQAQYLSVTPLDITVDFVNDAVGRDVVGGTTGTADIRGTYVGTPSRWIYRLLSYGTTTVVQDWRDMGAVSASNGAWSGTVSLPLGGAYAVEAGYLAADGSLHSATSNATMCAIRGTYYGQSNSTGRGGNSYSPATTPGPVAARTDTIQGIPDGTFANGNRKYSFPSAYEAPRVAYTASGTPFFMDIRGVAGVGINALVPGGGAWQTFLDGVACTRGVVEFVVWDQGEGDADGAGTLSGYADTFRNKLLPAMRTATGNPALKVFINPVGRYASTTQPAASFNTAAANDANREILRQAYLTIIANEPNVSFAASKLGCIHTDSYHYGAPGYVEMGRREGFTIAKAFGASVHDGIGPKVTSATRAGAVITLAIDLNGATGLTGPTNIATGTVPTPPLGNALNGFQVSKDGFATTLPISTLAISGNTLVITLASDPGAAVSVRSHHGWSYDDTNAFYGTYPDTTPIPVFPTMTPVVAA